MRKSIVTLGAIILFALLAACQGAATPASAPSGAPPSARPAGPTAAAPAAAGKAAPAATPTVGGPPPAPVPAAAGKIVYAKEGGLWTLEPATGKISQLLTIPASTSLASPAVSPDGSRIAYSLYDTQQALAKKDNGTDLYVVGGDGKNPKLLAPHQEVGAWLSEPTWTGDGKTVLFSRRDAKGKERIDRVAADGTGRATVMADRISPSVVGDRLAYLVTDAQAYTVDLWVADTSGQNPRRLLGDPEFQALGAPRLSPDGQRIAFVGVGGPDRPSPRGQGVAPLDPWAWLRPRAAEAHGIPYYLWSVNIDGSDLRRLTLDLEVELPVTAWSPDGKWLTFVSDRGLNLVSADGKEVHFVAAEFAVGGMDWTK